MNITIDIEARHIPDLICTQHSESSQPLECVAALSQAVAEALDLRDFVARPDRIHELRRLLWEQHILPLHREHPAEPVAQGTGVTV